MCGEDYDSAGCGVNVVEDFTADGLEVRVDGVGGRVAGGGAAMGE